MFYRFEREKEREERERETNMSVSSEWETNIDWLPPVLTRDGTCNLGVCSDWKSKP